MTTNVVVSTSRYLYRRTSEDIHTHLSLSSKYARYRGDEITSSPAASVPFPPSPSAGPSMPQPSVAGHAGETPGDTLLQASRRGRYAIVRATRSGTVLPLGDTWRPLTRARRS